MTITPPIMQTQYIDAPGSGPAALEAISQIDNIGNEPDSMLGEENEVQQESGKEGSEASSQESSEESSKEEVAAVKEEVETPSEPVKVVSAFLGDKQYDVPENAVFKVKVDGKELEVTLPELQKNFQGKIPWERHYHESKVKAQQLAQDQAAFEAKQSSAQAKLDKILETFEKNPYLAFDEIAKMKGKNPAEYLPVYIAQSRKTMEELEKLSDAQFQALLIQKKVAYDKEQLDEKQAEFTKKEEAATQQGVVKQAEDWFAGEINTNSFTQDELTMAQEVISKHSELPKMTPQQIAENMKAYILEVERPFTMVENAARDIDASLVNNRELITEVKKLINPSFTKDDVALILREYIKDSSLKPQPTATASSVGTSSAGSKSEAPAKPTKVAQQSVEPKVSGNNDVGPMTIWDLVSDYQ
jgi:hypothetical protein